METETILEATETETIFRPHKPNQKNCLNKISNKMNNIKPKIINLSTYKLNTNLINLLKLGQKFPLQKAL